MKTILLFTLNFLLIFKTVAQAPCNYATLLAEGRSLASKEAYRAALKKFNAARTCAPDSAAVVDREVDKIFDTIEAQKKEAVRLKNEAVTQRNHSQKLLKTIQKYNLLHESERQESAELVNFLCNQLAAYIKKYDSDSMRKLPGILTMQSHIMLDTKNFDNAIALSDSALVLDSLFMEAYENKIVAYSRQSEYLAANREAHKLLKLQPFNATALSNLAHNLAYLGSLPEAEREMEFLLANESILKSIQMWTVNRVPASVSNETGSYSITGDSKDFINANKLFYYTLSIAGGDITGFRKIDSLRISDLIPLVFCIHFDYRLPDSLYGKWAAIGYLWDVAGYNRAAREAYEKFQTTFNNDKNGKYRSLLKIVNKRLQNLKTDRQTVRAVPKDYAPIVLRINELMMAERFAEAEALVRELEEMPDLSYEAKFLLAVYYYRRATRLPAEPDLLPKSIEIFSDLAEANPRISLLRSFLGWAKFRSRSYSLNEIQHAMNAALEINPFDTDALQFYAELRNYEAKYEQSLLAYRTMLHSNTISLYNWQRMEEIARTGGIDLGEFLNKTREELFMIK